MRHIAVIWLVTAVLLLATATSIGAANPNANLPAGWVEFTRFEYRGEDPLVAGAGQFRNPILPGFYPDPSICRAGDAYFLVTSTFAYFPGIPIFKSTDLVNWTQIGHVLTRPSQLNSAGLYTSEGVFAPAISFHDGTFYVLNTLVGAGGNYYVTATNPAGPWSDPIWLKDVNGIDPDFFFDDDGKAYLIHNGPPPDDKPLYNGHRALWLYEFDLAAKNVKRETGRIIVNGGTDLAKKPVWIEGPHLFKRNGTYYLIAAEGGTSVDHSQVVFRSKSVWGPWEPFAGNPILTQRHLDPNRPDAITCVGHCDFVETPAGEWWSIFLGCRPYETGVGDMTNLGRETFMLPVKWQDDGWPTILRGEERVPRIVDVPKGAVAPKNSTERSFIWTDELDGKWLAPEWEFLRTPPAEPWHSLTAKPGSLMIAPRDVDLRSKSNPSFITRRQQHAKFTATTTLHTDAVRGACDAGLAAFANETYLFLGVRINAGGAREAFVEQVAASKRSNPGQAPPPALPKKIVGSKPLPPGTSTAELRIEGDGRWYSFAYRTAEKGDWISVADKIDASILSTHESGGFVGTTLGMFARADTPPADAK